MANTYYVATDSHAGNDGSVDHPLTIDAAVSRVRSDPGQINDFLAQNGDPTSRFGATFIDPATGQQVAGFFTTQHFESGWTLSSGAIRLADSQDVNIYNNLISDVDGGFLAIDSSAGVSSSNTHAGNSLFAGSDGVRIRDDIGAPGALTASFTRIADAGFVDATHGDYRLTAVSPAIDAGNNVLAAGITTDINGSPRTGTIDVGAFEFTPKEAP
jgi:hypothetical protein